MSDKESGGSWGSFQSPVLGAGGILIRKLMKSLGFQTGVSGWQLEQNGDAELNSVTVRGELKVEAPTGAFIDINSNATTAFVEVQPPALGVHTISSAVFQGVSVAGAPDYVSLEIAGPSLDGGSNPLIEMISAGPGQAEINVLAINSLSLNAADIDVSGSTQIVISSPILRLFRGADRYPMVDAGIITVNVIAGAQNAVVNGNNFTRTFTSLPSVSLTLRDSSGTLGRWTCRILGMSNTQFNFVVEKGAAADVNAAANVTATVHWQAVEV
jgi:hypothetical protein